MLPQAEVLLMLVAVGLYLYDSALLLHINEAVLAPGQQGGWRVRFGSSHVSFKGKELYLASPFLPHRPEFRLLWGLPSRPVESYRLWEARRDLFKPLAPLVWAVAVALFVLLPLGLFSVLGEWILLVAMAVLYVSIAGAVVLLGGRRKALGMSRRRFAALAFELFACPPFAVNMVRRVSMDMPLDADLISVARELLAPADWSATRAEFLARLEEQIEAEDENSERFGLLSDSRRKLIEETPCPA